MTAARLPCLGNFPSTTTIPKRRHFRRTLPQTPHAKFAATSNVNTPPCSEASNRPTSAGVNARVCRCAVDVNIWGNSSTRLTATSPSGCSRVSSQPRIPVRGLRWSRAELTRTFRPWSIRKSSAGMRGRQRRRAAVRPNFRPVSLLPGREFSRHLLPVLEPGREHRDDHSRRGNDRGDCQHRGDFPLIPIFQVPLSHGIAAHQHGRAE